MQDQRAYCLVESSTLPVSVEKDFNITEALSFMQRGLPAAYDYSDLIYVYQDDHNTSGKKSSKKQGFDYVGFKKSLATLFRDTFPQKFVACQSDLKRLTCDQLLIAAFDTDFWNQLNMCRVDTYKPSWDLPVNERRNQIAEGFPVRKKIFYKFNIKMLFQVKKMEKTCHKYTRKVKDLLTKYNLKFQTIQGESRQFCGVANAIIAGRYNDGIQKPKDPFTFYLHCLLGYDKPEHVGGSYLVAQKCIFDWLNIHASSESLPGVIGRNDIKNGSTIFSQHPCPRSHIKLSRIKDENGNPVTMHRQSKSFTTSKFNPLANRGLTDNINPQEGLFFLAYHKDPKIIQKMMLSQLGNNNNSGYEDGLLNHFKTQFGNVLYVPNIFQITGFSLTTVNRKPYISELCEYHQTRWLKHFKRNEEDEQNYKHTGNPYFLYSRAGFMKKMSYYHEHDQDLHRPSPRIMRILSKTFSLWQDTWYYDRSQRDFPHLKQFWDVYDNFLRDQQPPQNTIQDHKRVVKMLQNLQQATSFDLRADKGLRCFTQLPFVIRNGLAIYLNLGYLVSSKEYGCRGPFNSSGEFGANTFHIEVEDVLVGGQANLTFGQGKNLIEYLTPQQMQHGWLFNKNLSAHSGIGHINPYVDEILEHGLGYVINQFRDKAKKYQLTKQQRKVKDKTKELQQKEAKYNLFISSVFALLGMQKYFQNYAQLAQEKLNSLGKNQKASRQSLNLIKTTMQHLSQNAPIRRTPRCNEQTAALSLRQAAQLILSTFICLHLSGEPVSLGRLDYALRNHARSINQTNYEPTDYEQDIIDSFWVKVGQKANFNKGFFEDHQKWGNLAMGGNSSPYPQGASFNQWGQQLTVGGSNTDDTPFYNSITIACLRAARRIPVNAPCLGLRLQKDTPRFIIEQATKAVLAGGAHPILLNDQKIITGLQKCGNYKISEDTWKEDDQMEVDGKKVKVPYKNWNPLISVEDRYNYGSDGCHEFLPIGKSWFWLGGGDTLKPLEYVINEGKNLLLSGPRYIHGARQSYRWRKLETYQKYEQLEKQYFAIFRQIMQKGFYWQLSGFENLSQVCPATLLNAFTENMRDRESDFYLNGSTYKIFSPQYTGVANVVNALWNIKTLVFQQKVTTLEQIRNALLVNWGDQLQEPFVPRTLPPIMKSREKQRCDMLREIVWKQPKFGLDPKVTSFGLRLSHKMSRITREIFEKPIPEMLKLFKTLTYKFASAQAPFGFQYLPGCGTFENFADVGSGLGASFDGRKKEQPLAEDYAPQNFLFDVNPHDPKLQVPNQYLVDILNNYTHNVSKSKFKCPYNKNSTNPDPQFFSGAVLDLNIDEDQDRLKLSNEIQRFAKGVGPNMITISTGSRKLLEQARYNTDRDLLRFRQGGWSEFAVSMFPHILEHHVRRVRSVPKPDQPQPEEPEVQQASQPKKKVKKDRSI